MLFCRWALVAYPCACITHMKRYIKLGLCNWYFKAVNIKPKLVNLTRAVWISPSQQPRTAPRSADSPSSPPCDLLSACRCSSPLQTELGSHSSLLSAKFQSWTPSSGLSRSGEPRSKDRRFGTWKCSSLRAVTESLASPSSSLRVRKSGLARDGKKSL